MELDSYLYTNTGGRPYNEDRAGCRIKDSAGIFLVADGLGGHQGGAQASSLVADSLLNAWEEESGTLSSSHCTRWLEEQVQAANESLINAQRENRNSMKSTLAALVVKDGTAAWCHVGDSRLYYLTGGRLGAVTRDHSVTYKKYLAGEIERNEINFDEDRSSLLRVVGDTERCAPEPGAPAGGGMIFPGDAFLLCSDGFWEYIFDEEVLIDRLKADSAKAWAELMLVRALPRIAPESDNLTLLTVLVR